jgi:hypothetical protein
MEITDERQREIVRIAYEHEGRFLLPRRYRKSEPPTELDLQYEACQALVDARYAVWLGGNSAPGIQMRYPPMPGFGE